MHNGDSDTKAVGSEAGADITAKRIVGVASMSPIMSLGRPEHAYTVKVSDNREMGGDGDRVDSKWLSTTSGAHSTTHSLPGTAPGSECRV